MISDPVAQGPQSEIQPNWEEGKRVRIKPCVASEYAYQSAGWSHPQAG